jgi:hypothetical protein
MPGQKYVEQVIDDYTALDKAIDPAGCELGIYRSPAFEIPSLPPPIRGLVRKHHCNLPGFWYCFFMRAREGDEWYCDCDKGWVLRDTDWTCSNLNRWKEKKP